MKIKKLFISLILGLGLSLGLVGLLGSGLTVVRAADFTVNTTTDENDGNCTDGDCSLRDAIILANGNGEGDTITLGNNTYGLTLIGANENAGATGDLDITAPLTIIGQGPAQTIIDASGVISDRVLDIQTGAGTVVISGVTVINGNVINDWGGGIRNEDADLTLINTVVVSNTTSLYGGGVSSSRGNVTLSGTQILSNTALRGGGVSIHYSPGALTQTGDSTIAYNHAITDGMGGGVYVGSASATLEAGQIVSNTASTSGGGVYVSNGNVTLSGGQILSNTASTSGGGVYVGAGSMTLNGGQIVSNTASTYGGGMYVQSGGATLSTGQILGNAANEGGGVYVSNASATFTQTGSSTIAHNTAHAATSGGGGVFISSGRATLSGGQILNNTAGYGGGVYIRYGSATLSGGQILSNTADYGGGVYVYASSGVFTQTGVSTIAHNTVITNGGGVYVDYGSATLDGGQILDNAAADGGGVYIRYGRATLSGGQIVSNTASSDGGGVYVWTTNAVFTQTGVSTITFNNARNGGGVYLNYGSATLSGGAICSNKASGSGGGMYIQGNDARVNVSRGQIISNTASGNGGGIYHNAGTLTLVNTTLSGNRGTNKTPPLSIGGGLYVASGTVVLTYTTVASNTAASGGWGIHRASGTVRLGNTIVAYNGAANCNPGSGPGLTSDGYNLDSGNTCGLSAAGDITNTNPLLGPLADNGGNTLTHALLDGSPAIDQGNCVAGVATDQRGVSRPQDAACDIGAFERGPAVGPGTGGVYLPIIMRN